MSKEDFRVKIEELNRIGIIRIATDFYMEPDSRLFVKSPKTADKTRSLKLYPNTGRFYDFATSTGGDIIGFIAYLQGCNQWKALQTLSAYYGLSSDRQQDKEEARQKIQRQQAEERKRAARKQAFHAALFGEIDRLKDKLEKYTATLQKSKTEPFCDLWTDIQNEIPRTDYKLDILTAADMATYRRMKPNSDLGLSSDRPTWLLDCLAILAEVGAFEATREEIGEITAQRDFELCRVPGHDRRCKIEW